MKKNNYVRKTSFLLGIGLAILMIAAISANADRIMDEHVVDSIDTAVKEEKL
jgi:lipoprotein signal peptidase